MLIRAFRDDASAWNCIARATEDVQTSIIVHNKGSMDERVLLTSAARRFGKELQLAVVEGGRAEFDRVVLKLKDNRLAPLFEKQINRHLATVPPPKRRGTEPARGTGYDK